MSRQPHWKWLSAAIVMFVVNSPLFLPAATSTVEKPVEPVVESVPDLREQIVGVLKGVNSRLSDFDAMRIANSVMRCEVEQSLAPDLVLGVILVESSGKPSARSPKGALGLMQVMPHMFEELSLPGNAGHIEANIEAGCMLLADNIRRLGESDGISSYFWGSRIRGDRYLRRVRLVRRNLILPSGSPAS